MSEQDEREFFGKPIYEMSFKEYQTAVRSSDGIERCPIQPFLKVFYGKWNLRVMFERRILAVIAM